MHDTLEKNAANYVPLSPVPLLSRTADVHPDRIAVRYGREILTYAQWYRRCLSLASALERHGIKRGDVVSILAPNVPAHLDAHFGVPMAGAVLHSINIRLDANTIAFMLTHAGSSFLLVDAEFLPLALDVAARMESGLDLVVIEDDTIEAQTSGIKSYEEFLATGSSEFVPLQPADEWDAISLNYTSGTTGDPKGVVYHHRGAHLNAVGNVLAWTLGAHPVYLWTLPMFHCNGWCFPWTITALAGTHICLRRVDAGAILSAVVEHGVTHLAGAPIILSRMVNAPADLLTGIKPGLRMMVAGAPPSAHVIGAAERLGIEVTQTYGLTEVYGPCVVCEWREEWDDLSLAERARLKARQGVRYHLQEAADILDPVSMEPVPADGTTIGEIMIRGNIVMKGYLGNAAATDAAFSGDWFHSGDLAVKHTDGYVEIRDRAKDIIISGGENISSVEVESVLLEHPSVLEAAVVARRDDNWGEVPCAFVHLKVDPNTSADQIIAFCRSRLAAFKVPKMIVFSEIPKTATGKVQKNVLRKRADEVQSEPSS
ncbi:MAG: AMP-binding protein [Sphingobium sp.]|uniref:AMP-binding protein n=1 Tax=Sphingobium sp. TaxID=1912891 RepID=UPI0029BAB680|nr:AMP-binding protein [Sphingobium sp.]MDX3910589.1 AMP-binding protein [Sphingobium sp.]